MRLSDIIEDLGASLRTSGHLVSSPLHAPHALQAITRTALAHGTSEAEDECCRTNNTVAQSSTLRPAFARLSFHGGTSMKTSESSNVLDEFLQCPALLHQPNSRLHKHSFSERARRDGGVAPTILAVAVCQMQFGMARRLIAKSMYDSAACPEFSTCALLR